LWETCAVERLGRVPLFLRSGERDLAMAENFGHKQMNDVGKGVDKGTNTTTGHNSKFQKQRVPQQQVSPNS
jgi:hypothetical protein